MMSQGQTNFATRMSNKNNSLNISVKFFNKKPLWNRTNDLTWKVAKQQDK